MEMELCLQCTFTYVGICDTCCAKYNVCKTCVLGECETCEFDEGVDVSQDYVLINQIIEENWVERRSGPDDEEWIGEDDYESYFDFDGYYEGGVDV